MHLRLCAYVLVYGKACHLPVELKHKVYWAVKFLNFDEKHKDERECWRCMS